MIRSIRQWWYRGKRNRRKRDEGLPYINVYFHSSLTAKEWDSVIYMSEGAKFVRRERRK